MITIDTTNMCSHLQQKLFEKDGQYHSLWIAIQDDSELTAVVRSRQLHIYRNGKKVLVLAGKSAPKIIREDPICKLLQIERIVRRRHLRDLADERGVELYCLRNSQLYPLRYRCYQRGYYLCNKESLPRHTNPHRAGRQDIYDNRTRN